MACRGRFTTFFAGGYGRLKAALGGGRWIPDRVGEDMSRSSRELGDRSWEMGKTEKMDPRSSRGGQAQVVDDGR